MSFHKCQGKPGESNCFTLSDASSYRGGSGLPPIQDALVANKGLPSLKLTASLPMKIPIFPGFHTIKMDGGFSSQRTVSLQMWIRGIRILVGR